MNTTARHCTRAGNFREIPQPLKSLEKTAGTIKKLDQTKTSAKQQGEKPKEEEERGNNNLEQNPRSTTT